MSWLALSAGQALLAGLLTTGAVIALFFLKLRHRRVVVGSALLWRRVLEDPQSNSLIEKLRRWLSLVLALAIALLIALALARPYYSATGAGPQPVVLVLDTSASMAARTTSGRTRWEDATRAAERLLDTVDSASGIMIADTAGRVQTTVTQDRESIEEAIRRMQPFATAGRFPQLPTRDAIVYFMTDGVAPPADLPDDAHIVSVYEAGDNVAITAFEIRVDPTSPSGYRAFLEVANYSDSPKEVAILVTGVGGRRIVRAANIDAGASWAESLDLADFEGGGVQARVQTDDDRLAIDDVAFSYLPVRGALNVTLVTSKIDGYLETLLRITPEVELSVTPPERFEASVSTDVYVFEGTAPPNAPDRPSIVFGVPDTNWLPPVQGRDTEIELSTWDDRHPIMRFVPVYDLGIDAATVVDPEGHTVVAASRNTPLILVDDNREGSRTIVCTFDLDESDFAFHLGFPIFIENALAWFSGETLAETSGLGEIVLPAGAVEVTTLDGTLLETEQREDRTVAILMEPELVTAVADGRRIRVAANMTDPDVSDINRTSVSDASDSLTLPGTGRELWVPMLLLAMLLLAVEWWTYHRRITL